MCSQLIHPNFSALIIDYSLSLSLSSSLPPSLLSSLSLSPPPPIQNAPNWVLFNIASLYWRVKGDPSNALECLRRAVHFAPDDARGVGFVGVANVLHRVGYLNEAVIAVRAALDVHMQSVSGAIRQWKKCVITCTCICVYVHVKCRDYVVQWFIQCACAELKIRI